jgi:hypothetical protein
MHSVKKRAVYFSCLIVNGLFYDVQVIVVEDAMRDENEYVLHLPE